MIRKHENTVSWKAAMLAALVHLLLLAALFVSFNWKAAHKVVSVTEVELWDALPAQPTLPPPAPTPPPEVKAVPPPEPPKPVVVEKPEPEEPAVDIALEKKKQQQEEMRKKEAELEKQKQAKLVLQKLEQQKKLEEKRKKAAELEKIQAALRDEALSSKKAPDDTLKKLQDEVASESGAQQAQAASAATSATVDAFIAKIQAKVKGNVNRSLCGDGKPQLTFKISVLPTGELSGQPKLTKSSGNPICDDAVERAIMASEPLPLPTDPAALAQFRNMNLLFKPNE